MSDSHRICVICDVKERYSNEKLFFAKFPLDEYRCKQWVKLIGKEDLVYLPIEKFHQLRYVCGKHFEKRDFTKTKTRLKKRAVPKLHLSLPPLPDALLEGFPLHKARTNRDKNPFYLRILQTTLPCSVVVPVEAEVDRELPSTSVQTQVVTLSMPSTSVQPTAPSTSHQPETPSTCVQLEAPKNPADNSTVVVPVEAEIDPELPSTSMQTQVVTISAPILKKTDVDHKARGMKRKLPDDTTGTTKKCVH